MVYIPEVGKSYVTETGEERLIVEITENGIHYLKRSHEGQGKWDFGTMKTRPVSQTTFFRRVTKEGHKYKKAKIGSIEIEFNEMSPNNFTFVVHKDGQTFDCATWNEVWGKLAEREDDDTAETDKEPDGPEPEPEPGPGLRKP